MTAGFEGTRVTDILADQGRIARESVARTVANALRRGIFEGRYAPGQRLVEAELTAEYGASRGTVRAALTLLEAEGVVDSANGRGSRVPRMSRKAVANLFRVRGCVEALAARLAAERIDDGANRQWIEDACAVWDRQDVLSDGSTHITENTTFHDLIIQIADNDQLRRVVSHLQLPGYRLRFRLLLDQSACERSASEHKAIAHAILDGNAPRAEALVKAHFSWSGDLLQSLPDWDFAARE